MIRYFIPKPGPYTTLKPFTTKQQLYTIKEEGLTSGQKTTRKVSQPTMPETTSSKNPAEGRLHGLCATHKMFHSQQAPQKRMGTEQLKLHNKVEDTADLLPAGRGEEGHAQGRH